MEKKKRIEVVIPCYNEEECIPLIYQSIHEVAKKLPEYQVSILYVDDGSGDASFAKIKEVSERAMKTRCITFPLHEILVRRQPFTRDLRIQPRIT